MTTPNIRPRFPSPYVADLADLPWPQPVQWLSSEGNRVLVSGACILTGWAFRNEQTSAAFEFTLWDGDSTTGHRVASVAGVSNGAAVLATGWPGVAVKDSLYGTAGGGIFHGAVWVIVMPGGIS